MFVFLLACLFICLFIRVHFCVSLCMFVYLCACLFVCLCVHVNVLHVQEVEARKSARIEALQRQTAARNRKEVEAWSRRMGERENEAKRREHAERLKQLSVSMYVHV